MIFFSHGHFAVMFIDQPIGAGFSTGKATVSTSEEAATYLWTALQMVFSDAQFSKYLGRE
jgi:carboxypeptidase C (cathepsin A)